MNIKLLLKIRDNLTNENYDQNEWCGTACCITGHACLFGGWSAPSDEDDYGFHLNGPMKRLTGDLARELLGLDWIQARKLFFADSWPDQFREKKSPPKWERNGLTISLKRTVKNKISYL